MTSRRGFSLLEVLIVIAVSMIIGTAVVMLLISQTQLTTTQNRNMVNQQSLRDTVNFMRDEILSMGSSTIEPYLSEAGVDDLLYVGDLDGDDVPDQVRFFLEGAELKRTLYSTDDDGATWTEVATDVLVPNVQSLAFLYYTHGNELMDQPIAAEHTEAPLNDDVDEVTSIEIQLTLDIDYDATVFTAGKIAPQSMVGRITVRNRMYR